MHAQHVSFWHSTGKRTISFLIYTVCSPSAPPDSPSTPGSLRLTLCPGGRPSVGCCMAPCYLALSFPSEISAGCGRTESGSVSSHALPCRCVIFLIGPGTLNHDSFCPFSQTLFSRLQKNCFLSLPVHSSRGGRWFPEHSCPWLLSAPC